MKKRLTAMILCLLMLFVFAPAAFADGEAEEPAAQQPEATEEIAATAEEPEQGLDAVESKPEDGVEAIGLDPVEDIEASNVIYINEDNFPDGNFRKWIVANVDGVSVDANGVCSISRENAKKVLAMDIQNQEIGTLAGINKFPNVKELNCSYNEIKRLDVSGLTALEYLACIDNNLEKIILGKTTSLATVICTNNKLTALDLTYNTALKTLVADQNAITSLKTSACTALETLNVSGNKIKTLDLSKNTKLKALVADGNELTKLDVTKNTALEKLIVSNNKLDGLDVTKNTKLVELECQSCELDKLTLTSNTALTSVNVNLNALKTLDVSKNTKLVKLTCEGNELKTLNVSNNTALEELDACGNLLTAIDVTKNTKLTDLALYDNQIKTLDVTKNVALVRLNVASNEIAALDLSKCTALEELDCQYNKLETLDLTKNVKLKDLDCSENRLAKLKLDMLPLLEKVSCNGQEVLAPDGVQYSGGDYKFNMRLIFTDGNYDDIEMAIYPLNKLTGWVTLPGYLPSFDYLYDTGRKDTKMTVSVLLPYTGSGAKVVFNKSSVQFKGDTPYVIYNEKAQEPEFTVYDDNDKVISPTLYTYTYKDNIKPGTGLVDVKFINSTSTASGWFKIYMPATGKTAVENVKTGIKITWDAVKEAKGYVIYRRAWSSTTNGWTEFKRWNNTTKTEWTDTTVYAGTRYQYGIKAYYADPMDNYNLGVVGPLKTTVRITTRVLKEVKPYAKKMVVKWEPSKVFTGYEVQYARDAVFTKSVKSFKVKTAATDTKTISNLLSKTYYVRVRSYHEFEGMTYYGEWSNVISANVK